jgi:hypothetical protein
MLGFDRQASVTLVEDLQRNLENNRDSRSHTWALLRSSVTTRAEHTGVAAVACSARYVVDVQEAVSLLVESLTYMLSSTSHIGRTKCPCHANSAYVNCQIAKLGRHWNFWNSVTFCAPSAWLASGPFSRSALHPPLSHPPASAKMHDPTTCHPGHPSKPPTLLRVTQVSPSCGHCGVTNSDELSGSGGER